MRLSSVLVRELPLARLDADDLELLVSDAHGLPDRILAGEELRGRGQSEHHDAAAEVDVGRGDQPARLSRLVVDVGVGGRDPEQARGRLEAPAETLRLSMS